MRTTKRLALVVLAGVCLAAMIVTVLRLARRWSLPRPRHFTAIECTLATGEVVSVGWVQTLHLTWISWARGPWKHASYEYFLSWRSDGRHRTYLIAEPSYDYNRLQLRGKADRTGVWVVADRSEDLEVLASLDLTTGECRDWNMYPVEGRGTIPIRIDPTNNARETYPEWATPDGGVLLGRWEKPPYRPSK